LFSELAIGSSAKDTPGGEDFLTEIGKRFSGQPLIECSPKMEVRQWSVVPAVSEPQNQPVLEIAAREPRPMELRARPKVPSGRCGLRTDRSVCIVAVMGNSNSTIDQIFFAVMELILEGGLSAVTLSSVCKRAEISKGGLTHHYPTKEALVDAFVSRSSDEWLSEIQERLEPIAGRGGERTKAFVDLMLKDPAMCNPESSREIAAVMIALMHGQMVFHAEQYHDRLAEELRGDGLSKPVIDLVVASIDGLWLQAAVLPLERVAKRAARIRLQLRRLIDADRKRPAPSSLIVNQVNKTKHQRARATR
jgi:AcrR family transcriptional regulator